MRVRVDDAAVPKLPPPAGSAGVAAMAMGATMWIFGARFFFGQLLETYMRREKNDQIMLMDQAERF